MLIDLDLPSELQMEFSSFVTIYQFQKRHAAIYKQYQSELKRAKNRRANSSDDEVDPTNCEEEKFRILFDQYFRKVSENQYDLAAECKFCPESNVLRTNKKNTSTLTRHLKVCFCNRKKIFPFLS